MTTWGAAIAGWVEVPVDWRMGVLALAGVELRTELVDESSGNQLSAGSGCAFILAWQHALVNMLDGMTTGKMPVVIEYVRRHGVESMRAVDSAWTIGGVVGLLALVEGEQDGRA